MRLLVGATVALVLAGCMGAEETQRPPIAEPPPPAKLVCFTDAGIQRCNLIATVQPESRQANELSIAINPTDPQNLIATGKDYTPGEAGDCVWAGIYTTLDAGRTWKNQNVPGSPWKWIADPSAPRNEFTNFWCATDPVVAFGPDGTAYWTVMPYQCDRLSGSKTGRDVGGTGQGLPQGGLNDWFWTCSSMYVLVSHDKGLTWPEWQQVAFGPRLEHDKQWIATAPNGDVLLCWDRATDAASTAGGPFQSVDQTKNYMACSKSTDKGKTFSEPRPLNPTWRGFTPSVDYDANNRAYAAYTDYTSADGLRGTILVSSSADGTTWDAPVQVGTFLLPSGRNEYQWPVLRGSAFRIVETPQVAIDRSSGPFAGSVYVTWFDHVAAHGEVRVAYSRDGGKTWNDSARPMDDGPGSRADQFYPAMSVGPDGIVDLTWYDRRDDPNNHLFHLYYAYSIDGGRTWSRNLRVTDVASDEQYSHHQNGMIFLGDYRDQDSTLGYSHLVWVDTRHHKADVYVAHVERAKPFLK